MQCFYVDYPKLREAIGIRELMMMRVKDLDYWRGGDDFRLANSNSHYSHSASSGCDAARALNAREEGPVIELAGQGGLEHSRYNEACQLHIGKVLMARGVIASMHSPLEKSFKQWLHSSERNIPLAQQLVLMAVRSLFPVEALYWRNPWLDHYEHNSRLRDSIHRLASAFVFSDDGQVSPAPPSRAALECAEKWVARIYGSHEAVQHQALMRGFPSSSAFISSVSRFMPSMSERP